MILPPRVPWRKLLAVTVLPLVVLAAILAAPIPPLTNPFAGHPVQAQPLATETPEPCEAWKTAGAQIIFKCIDEEPPYAVCYAPVGGVMQCVLE